MYAGRVMETLDAKALSKGKHPYTQGLLGCLPDLDHPKDRLATLARDPAWREAAHERCDHRFRP